MNELTQQGIAALKSGDRASARQLLTNAVRQNPNDAQAWLWLTGALDNDDERLACLRQVLRIDPTNQAAARGMAQITERRNRAAQPGTAHSDPVPPPSPDQAEPAAKPNEPDKDAAQPVQNGEPAGMRSPEPGLAAPAEALTEAATDLPAAEVAAVGAASSAQSIRRRTSRSASGATARSVFRVRPSLVPALLCFWLFLFGSVAVASLLSSVPDIALPLAGVVFLILELVVVYAVIRNLGVRYELTSQQLTLRSNGKHARIPITEIYHAELSQSFLQRLFGIGHIDIDAAVDGQLAHVRMRNISQAKRRVEQITYLVKDYAPS